MSSYTWAISLKTLPKMTSEKCTFLAFGIQPHIKTNLHCFPSFTDLNFNYIPQVLLGYWAKDSFYSRYSDCSLPKGYTYWGLNM